jgi:hypothetical protein
MPRSFVDLPPEIRNKVYNLCFAKPAVVTPIITPIRSLNNAREALPFAGSIPFLRTCNLVHLEASPVLYGNNTFFFDDVGKGFNEVVQQCDITSMYIFLRLIGAENRLRLRKIYVHIVKFRFCYYDSESIPGETAKTNGGKYLGDAFELLAQGHRLRSIKIILGNKQSIAAANSSYTAQALVGHLIRPIEKSKLLGQLQKVKGLKKFSLEVGGSKPTREPTLTAAQQLIYTALQQAMTRPSPAEASSQTTSAEYQAAQIGQKLMGMAKHRSVLQKAVKDSKVQLEKWKKLQARISDTSEQIRQWDAEIELIDSTLQAFAKTSATAHVSAAGAVSRYRSIADERVGDDESWGDAVE